MISYQLQRKRHTHSVRITIRPNGEVLVTAPASCPTSFVDRFVREHEDWITKNLAKVRAHAEKHPHNDHEILLFGQTYKKTVQFTKDLPIGVHIRGEEILINPVSNSEASIDRSLMTFLKTTAEKYIVPRTHQLAKKMDISFSRISLKNQSTRWGSCSSHGNLNFNWRLVHSPPPVIDYVIIHELAHRKQMNHSSKFWDIVAKFDPEHQKHRGWLKRQGMDLG